MSTRRRPLVLVVAAALASAGCLGGGSGNSSAAGPATVKIGLLAPLTGATRVAGAEARQGAELAAAIVNGLNPSLQLPLSNTGGLPNLGGAHLSIVTSDTAGRSDTVADKVSGLVNGQGVSALVGAYDSEVTMVASQRAEALTTPMVNADSSAGFLTERGLDWFFRLGPSTKTAGQAFFSLLKQKQAQLNGPDPARAPRLQLAILHASDRTGNDIEGVISGLASEAGYSAPMDVPFDPAATDLTAQIDGLRNAKPTPNVLFVASTPQTVPALLTGYIERHFKPDAVMSFGTGFLDTITPQQITPNAAVLGQAEAGLCREVAWSDELANRNPAARAVKNIYQNRYNGPMTQIAAEAFTAVLTVAQALDAAGTTEPARVRSALLNLNVSGQNTIMPWSGIQFDETHQNIDATSVIEQFINHTFQVVFPPDAATTGTTLAWPASSAA